MVEEVSASPCSVHQMPRPATTVLYTHPAILLSDYLFEADTVEDAQKNFDELLGLKTSIGKTVPLKCSLQFFLDVVIVVITKLLNPLPVSYLRFRNAIETVRWGRIYRPWKKV